MRVCVIGAGPCGLTAVKNLLDAGCSDVVCYEEHDAIGGNWSFTDDPARPSVHEATHVISSRRLSAFDGFPMPADYPDFPSHRQLLAYFVDYSRTYGLSRHIRLGSRVEQCTPSSDGGWVVRVAGKTTPERFDAVLVCSGHHRDPYRPDLPGTFSGTVLHSSAYKRASSWRGQRVLVVGGGNSAADVAVDVARVAAHTAISLRRGTYVLPKLVFGRPVDAVYEFWLPRPILQWLLRVWLRLAVGRYPEYGLPAPAEAPLVRPPTLNPALLDALRHGRVVVRRGISRCDGRAVHFTDGTRDEFDTIVLGTGFHASVPFLPAPLWKDVPLRLGMVHPGAPNLFFIGRFQPIGCIWRLADRQARLVARWLAGGQPPTVTARPRSGLAVDYHVLRRELDRELARIGRRP
jgi:Flavin-binding monooxygenase-like